MLPASLLLLLAAVSCVQSYELTQPASLTVQPGQPMTISCKVSYSVTGYYTAWIRQPVGKTLEWIGNVYSGDTQYKDSLKNKFSLSVDSSSNVVFLKGQNLQTEDSAVYYCAYPHSDTNQHKSCTKTNLLGFAVQKMEAEEQTYAVAWIRQSAGKPMECIFYIWGGGSFYLNNALKNKFSFRRDMSSSTSTLIGQNLQTEDTAVYYCARRPQ
ncbi:unnamed protein product [Oncorhynchus mykiss]|uniref:Ig-like domain-containing protein n=1 Tax=Oncorhynchus mykiss TaxID=8022 RepID=A0A060YI80_ONCMY|nr:unnamed protein product [Oncorhynchus mykiss]